MMYSCSVPDHFMINREREKWRELLDAAEAVVRSHDETDAYEVTQRWERLEIIIAKAKENAR